MFLSKGAIFLIALTFLVYIVINTGDERPERTYLYIIPLFIVCTIAFIKHVIVNHNKPILYILLGLILISIIISSIVNIQNSKPFIDLKGDMALQWISDNNLSNQQIFASGYYSQVGRSQNINFLGLTYYNREVFNRFIVPNKLNNSFFLDDVYNKYADIKYLYGETQKIQNTLNVLYSNNNQMIIQKTTP